MTIEKKVEGTTACLKLSGWLDTQTSPQLVSAYKKMNGELTLRNVSAEVMSVISMTGIDKRITIEK